MINKRGKLMQHKIKKLDDKKSFIRKYNDY